MGVCLTVCGRAGHYSPRRMEEKHGIRSVVPNEGPEGVHTGVYRKVNNSQTSKFGSKTVVQPWPMGEGAKRKVAIRNNDTSEGATKVEGETIDIHDLQYFQNEEWPPHYAAVELSQEQRDKIVEYLSVVCDEKDISYLYQYYPPGLPPGPYSVHVKHITYYLEHEKYEKGEPEDLIALIQHLRCRQFQKLVSLQLHKLNPGVQLWYYPTANG